MNVSLPPALKSFGNWLDLLRVKAPEQSSQAARLQKPVSKVQRLWRQADGFEAANGKLSPRGSKTGPKVGAGAAHNFHRDGFEAAVRKPVELAPKAPPAVRAAPTWLKENSAAQPKPDFVASFASL